MLLLKSWQWSVYQGLEINNPAHYPARLGAVTDLFICDVYDFVDIVENICIRLPFMAQFI